MNNKNEQTIRLKKILKRVAVVLCIGILYALFVQLTGLGVPCIFNMLTGKLCPGCGISRMFMALLRFDIVLAAQYNIFVLCLLPLFAGLAVYKAFNYIKTGKNDMSGLEKGFYIIVFVLCVVFTVLRNTELIPFLLF